MRFHENEVEYIQKAGLNDDYAVSCQQSFGTRHGCVPQLQGIDFFQGLAQFGPTCFFKKNLIILAWQSMVIYCTNQWPAWPSPLTLRLLLSIMFYLRGTWQLFFFVVQCMMHLTHMDFVHDLFNDYTGSR